MLICVKVRVVHCHILWACMPCILCHLPKCVLLHNITMSSRRQQTYRWSSRAVSWDFDQFACGLLTPSKNHNDNGRLGNSYYFELHASSICALNNGHQASFGLNYEVRVGHATYPRSYQPPALCGYSCIAWLGDKYVWTWRWTEATWFWKSCHSFSLFL